MKGQRIVASFLDVMKLLRTEPMTRQEIAAEAEVQIDTARRWIKDLQEAGMVAAHGKEARPLGGGRPADKFAVTKAWGGVA